jgi:hypothetical protein
MVQRIAWFTRKFSFDLIPVWMYPNIVERVRGTPARLEDLLRGLSPEILTRRDGNDVENRKTHEANHNADTAANILSAFRAERMEFVRRLDAYDEAFVQKTSLHPRLQVEIRPIDLAFFIAEHDDHHLARVSELIRLFAK